MSGLDSVLIGAMGDLVRRMLWPLLHSVNADRLLPNDLRIAAEGRSDLSQDAFRNIVGERNRLVERFATRTGFHYVDVATPMIDRGAVRDIFRPDDLHMTPAGYRIWASKLRPLVLREAAGPAPRFEAALSGNSDS